MATSASWTSSSLCCKLNVAFSVGLVQHFGRKNLRSFAVDPDVILARALARSVPPEDFVGKGWVDEKGNLNPAIVSKILAQGSSTGIVAAFDSTLFNDKGYYMADGAMTEDGLLPAAVDPALAQKLWEISEVLVK